MTAQDSVLVLKSVFETECHWFDSSLGNLRRLRIMEVYRPRKAVVGVRLPQAALYLTPNSLEEYG